jgi:hypothetical protein
MKIAFGYKMGVGKDTAVDYLVDTHGGRKISFAAPLYDILYHAQDICGFPRQKDRKFLQWIGAEWGRAQKDSVWVDIAINKARGEGNYFCSDVRFPNEFQALKDNGWVCVKLLREASNERVGSGTASHCSENALDVLPDTAWDFVVANNGDLEGFYDKLDEIVQIISS